MIRECTKCFKREAQNGYKTCSVCREYARNRYYAEKIKRQELQFSRWL